MEAGQGSDLLKEKGSEHSLSKLTPRQRLLEEAMKITGQDRNKAYGNPEDNFTNIANLWNAYFDASQPNGSRDCTASDVANLMILMKVARLSTNLGHRDSAVDIAGYAACLADCQEASAKSAFLVGVTSQPTQPIDGVRFSNSPTMEDITNSSKFDSAPKAVRGDPSNPYWRE